MKTENRFTSLEEEVFATLEEEILSGVLKRGTALTENALSARLGVSRTPIRSALARLAEDGLVKSVANRGAVVVGITEEDLVDIYRIRIRLEGLASATAAEKISEAGLCALRDSVELAEFYISKKNTEKLRELDTAFHKTIYEECGNRLLCKTLSELHRKIKFYRKVALASEGRIESSVSEHREILRAIEAKDAAEADRLTSLHVEEAMRNLLSALKSADE